VNRVEIDELIRNLYTAVEFGDVEESSSLAERSVDSGYDPLEVMGGVTGALKDVGERFGVGELFLTELMFCGEAGKAALGIDVPDEAFVEKVRELKPDILGLSALITPTMFKFKDVVDALKEAGLRDEVKVIIGGASVNTKWAGASVNPRWAEESGADAFGTDTIDAIERINGLLEPV
jgi:methanogenic corrinoid protein MtbC1